MLELRLVKAKDFQCGCRGRHAPGERPPAEDDPAGEALWTCRAIGRYCFQNFLKDSLSWYPLYFPTLILAAGPSMRVLLIEDDPLLGSGIREGLLQVGYTVDWLVDGEMAEQALRNELFDLVVLDLGLPRRDGIDVLRQLRERGNPTPVLVLTARDTVEDRVRGLDTGADDYLVKPFDLDELCARLRALQRRRAGRPEPIIRHGALTLDPAAREVRLAGDPVSLSSREYTVLLLLLENAGRVLTRARLEEALYGWESSVESNSLEVFVHHLRKKLGPELIKTVRGIGYMIERRT